MTAVGGATQPAHALGAVRFHAAAVDQHLADLGLGFDVTGLSGAVEPLISGGGILRQILGCLAVGVGKAKLCLEKDIAAVGLGLHVAGEIGHPAAAHVCRVRRRPFL